MVKDEKPQFLNCSVTETAANTFTQAAAIPTGVNGQNVSKDKVRVMEIMKIFVIATLDTLAEDGGLEYQITTKSKAAMVDATSISDAILYDQIETQLVTSGGIVRSNTTVYDMTDGAGNGICVATPSLYVAAKGTGQANARAYIFKILYKFTEISVSEFIGMVQSQQ